MRRGLLSLLSLSFLLFFSCGDDNKDNLLPVDEEWKKENDAFMLKIAQDPAYTKLQALNHAGDIYYKVIEEGDNDFPLIVYGDKVRLEYKGSFIDGTVFDSALLEDRIITDFWDLVTDPPIPGFLTALQYMKEGDKWEIWIPQELAYGRTGSRNKTTGEEIIPPYSALKFYIHILEVNRVK